MYTNVNRHSNQSNWLLDTSLGGRTSTKWLKKFSSLLKKSNFWLTEPLLGRPVRVESKMDGLGSKWMVQRSESGRSKGKKVDGPKNPKVDCSEGSNWAVFRHRSGRYLEMKVDGLKSRKWTSSIAHTSKMNFYEGDLFSTLLTSLFLDSSLLSRVWPEFYIQILKF